MAIQHPLCYKVEATHLHLFQGKMHSWYFSLVIARNMLFIWNVFSLQCGIQVFIRTKYVPTVQVGRYFSPAASINCEWSIRVICLFLKIQQRSSISAVECRPYYIPYICFRCAFNRCFHSNWNSMEILSFSHPNCELFATDFVHGSQFIYQCIKKTRILEL